MNYDYENVLFNQRWRATEEAKLRYRLAPASANNYMNTVRRCLADKSLTSPAADNYSMAGGAIIKFFGHINLIPA